MTFYQVQVFDLFNFQIRSQSSIKKNQRYFHLIIISNLQKCSLIIEIIRQ
ncbi:hypothetical protein pb186bvf_019626 [Paramecium bursaria]